MRSYVVVSNAALVQGVCVFCTVSVVAMYSGVQHLAAVLPPCVQYIDTVHWSSSIILVQPNTRSLFCLRQDHGQGPWLADYSGCRLSRRRWLGSSGSCPPPRGSPGKEDTMSPDSSPPSHSQRNASSRYRICWQYWYWNKGRLHKK